MLCMFRVGQDCFWIGRRGGKVGKAFEALKRGQDLDRWRWKTGIPIKETVCIVHFV